MTQRLRSLLDRLSRLMQAERWTGDLNPAQAAALGYLARANRFSRTPSQVALWLGATRGTVSQTLHALERKGLVAATRSATDRRSLSYDLTEAGRAALVEASGIDRAIARLPPGQAEALETGLASLLVALLEGRQVRSFGICRDCRHHEARGEGGYCRLLAVALEPEETGLACFEHEDRAA